MRICNYCGWIGDNTDCVNLESIKLLCPQCKDTTRESRAHDYDDECVCNKCGLDGGEADYYSKRGYAHEYPTLHDCPERRS